MTTDTLTRPEDLLGSALHTPAEIAAATHRMFFADENARAVSTKAEPLLYRQLDLNASDLHLAGNQPPWVSRYGHTVPISDRPIGRQLLVDTLQELAGPDRWMKYLRTKRLDFGIATARSRFRVHYSIAGGLPHAVFRAIPNTIPDFIDLGVPGIIETFTGFTSGLVLFVGVTGSGKSTLQASMVKKKKDEDAHKIISIEEPVEYLHDPGKSLIIQREVGTDVDSFDIGVQDAMREAPDMILIGEMRDPNTVSAALSAASSGHLVFSTLHAESTADAPTRILDGTPIGRIEEVRAQLSRTLKAVVYQRLLPAVGGEGRHAATEVLIMNPAIRAMIRTNQLEGIAGQLNDVESGSIPLEVSLANLVLDEKVMESVAVAAELRKGSVREQIRQGHRR